MGQAITQFDLLHGESNGYAVIGTTSPKWEQHGFIVTDIKQALQERLGLPDIYLTQSTFKDGRRAIATLKELHACFTDLDYYKSSNPLIADLTPEQVTLYLENDYFGDSLPYPNYILFSGRGLQVVWLINTEGAKRLPEWSLVQKHINAQLKRFLSDDNAMDCTRVLRYEHTLNSKSGKMAEMLKIYSPAKYDLDDLLEYVDEPEPVSKPEGKLVRLFNTEQQRYARIRERTLLYSRMQDLIKLQELRNAAGILDGYREFSCFLYRYWSMIFCEDPRQALEEVLEFNANFLEPLPKNRVIIDTHSAEKAYHNKIANIPNGSYMWGGYKYRNSTLINKLGITPEEETKLSTIISKSEISRRDKEKKKLKRRNENGLTNRQQSIRKKENLILPLMNKEFTQSQIAEKLNICQSTVSRILKQYYARNV